MHTKDEYMFSTIPQTIFKLDIYHVNYFIFMVSLIGDGFEINILFM